MAWTRTRLEMPAITGDPSVLLATPTPDGGWTPRLDRTVTGGQVSLVSTLSPRPSSGVASCPCCGSELSGCVHPQACLSRPEGHLWSAVFRCRLLSRLDGLPAGITVEGATPPRRVLIVRHCVRRLTSSRAAPAAKKGGSLPPLPPPPGAAHGRGTDTAGAAPPRLSQPTRGIRANPCPIRLSRQGPDHSSEGTAL